MPIQQGSQSDFVEFKAISKFYGRNEVLSSVSVGIKQGQLLSLLGPSGCGKTTLLRILAGFATPTKGEVWVGGELLNRIPPNKRNVGMVFQHYSLFPHITVYENVTFGLKMRNMDAQTMEQRAMECLDLVHLADIKDKYPSELSGGMKQRIALARVLAIQPTVLLLDEPFAALDRNLKEEMRFEVRKLQQLLKITTLFVTHDQKEAMTISDRIAVMNYGQIEQEGRPLDIYDNPRTLFVAEFLGVPNLLNVSVIGYNGTAAEVQLPGGRQLTVPISDEPAKSEMRLAVRSESIRLMAGTPPASGLESNSLELLGEVTFASNVGSQITYEVQVTEGPKFTVEVPRQERSAGFRPGDSVRVVIEGRNCTLVES